MAPAPPARLLLLLLALLLVLALLLLLLPPRALATAAAAACLSFICEGHFRWQWYMCLQSMLLWGPQQQSSLQTGQPFSKSEGPCSSIIFSPHFWQ